jgi:hypothetical protein
MFKLAGKASAHHILRRQQGQKSQNGDTTPGQETKRRSEKASGHLLRSSHLGAFSKSGCAVMPIPPSHAGCTE